MKGILQVSGFRWAYLLGTAFLLLSTPPLLSQRILSGVVQDEASGEPLPFATVGYRTAGKGTVTDEEGQFLLPLPNEPDTLFVLFLGYEPYDLPVDSSTDLEDGRMVIRLKSETLSLSTVEIASRKGRYRRKGNPAVALIRKVIENKKRNRPQSQPYYQYDQYEKVEVGLTNLTESFTQRKIWKGYRFVFDYIDSTSFEKPVLPLFLQESTSTHYFRNDPKFKLSLQTGLKVSKPEKLITDQSVKEVFARLNQSIDLYQNQIKLFELEFVSPIADIAPLFYRYYLGDTVQVQETLCATLDFVPANPYSFGFSGSLFVALDSTFQVLGVRMEVPKTVNVNFMQRLLLEQDFILEDSTWVVARDRLEATLGLSPGTLSLRGQRTVYYTNHLFTPAPDPEIYQYKTSDFALPGNNERSEAFWDSLRTIPLNEREANIYLMVDSLNQNRSFVRLINLIKTASSGHFELGPFRIGSLYSLLSYNPIEGVRTRLGIQTNEKFHNHWRLGGYAAYGFGDQKVKFGGRVEYSFDEKLSLFPRHFLHLRIQNENEFPGQFTSFLDRDNIFFSYQIGVVNKMLNFQRIQLQYHKEFSPSFGMDLFLEHREQRAVGEWAFEFYSDPEDQVTEVERIKTTTAQLSFFFAPKAKWIETQNFRYIIPNARPWVSVDYRLGFDGFLGGEHHFHHLILGLRQRIFMGPAGFVVYQVQMGKLWGKEIPFPLVHIAESNQTISFSPRAFNLMNFMEFVADEHASLMVEYHLSGLILNRIPLIRKLKLREVVGFKLYYGRLTAANNPDFDRSLIQFPRNEQGVAETYSITGRPYMEISAGLSNILKVFRIDYVQRLSYLDHPNLPGLFGLKGAGIRVGLALRF